jgi:hypothetical protein
MEMVRAQMVNLPADDPDELHRFAALLGTAGYRSRSAKDRHAYYGF